MTTKDILSFIADFGDSAVIIALVLSSSCYLMYRKHYNSAQALVTTLLAVSGIIALLKLAFIACGHNIFDIRSPSGHAALSISVYGMFAIIFYRHFTGILRIIIPIFLVALSLIIAASRVINELHSLNEVIFGGLVGLAVLSGVWHWFLKAKPLAIADYKLRFKTAAVIAAIMIVVALLVHGTRLPAENFVKKKAYWLRHHIHACRPEGYPG
ncbi:MAG: hypothetical protein DI586_05555 [Micavibrio aeruginosavorus]|uniref:Phosphatidic acid phosphatase type 2/haloperoxidase domain-containing protein n=1 Tax=Micavibrio aeruginosavorus TaxID=349221 RepID=A0A2W5FL28_9BACT|nr:MAG: hypothetical protein DI586_05555 [Micavibrio aeruginosavorus]